MAAPHSTMKFWKPGTEAPGISEERDLSSETTGSPIIFNPNTALSIEKQRQKLPVFKHRNNILYLVESYQTVIIVGETGCGKTTQIPQYLLEAGWAVEGKVIGVTQPRRVAAISVANRVAEERGALLGHEVGYTIRFDDCSDPHATRIKFLTDGMLVREMMADPLLKKYRYMLRNKDMLTGHFIRHTLLVSEWTSFCIQNCCICVHCAHKGRATILGSAVAHDGKWVLRDLKCV
ncbi:ATPdependent RNA helicase [Characodon lateralis]|uniref:ATPdependent RNA helicase n=1 Tax=Characodon lateralis TaxID=208331 RepID=A0ABU7DZ26_9TELE|nr:ATPdependent RNA helicase [Characodon lateralis]